MFKPKLFKLRMHIAHTGQSFSKSMLNVENQNREKKNSEKVKHIF